MHSTPYGPNGQAVDAFLSQARRLTARQAAKLKACYERELPGLPHDEYASSTLLWRDAIQVARSVGLGHSARAAAQAAIAAVDQALTRLPAHDERRVVARNAAAAAVLALTVQPIVEFARLYEPWAQVVDQASIEKRNRLPS